MIKPGHSKSVLREEFLGLHTTHRHPWPQEVLPTAADLPRLEREARAHFAAAAAIRQPSGRSPESVQRRRVWQREYARQRRLTKARASANLGV